MKSTLLNEIYKVKTRFHKSVQIEQDIFFDDYIPTQSSLSSLKRILSALDIELGSRAWSIIGPYGSGKSAFILFLKTLLGDPNNDEVVRARNVLQRADKKLYKEIEALLPKVNGYCLALVSASRESLEYSILKALLNGLNDLIPTTNFSATRKQIENLLEKIQVEAYKPSNDEVLKLCSKVIKDLESVPDGGLLIVIDELGKNLESASLSSAKDIFILQKLAEMASRTKKIPFILVTVLHQSFDRYVGKLAIETRNEWSKIQGRFEDITYVDSSEQIYKLIASSIQVTNLGKKNRDSIDSLTSKTFEHYLKVFANDSIRNSNSFIKTLKSCFPLHPFSVMALVPLFRNKFAQNERSLFAFITSSEPFAFSEFLVNKSVSETEYPFFNLHNLYDYLLANLAGVLMTTANSRKWLEIDEALSKLSCEFQVKLIKTVGMFSLLKDSFPFPINKETLACALNCDSEDQCKQLEESLETLQAKSILVFRRHSSSYAIWGGSDIDIDEKIIEARRDIFAGLDIAKSLNEQLELRPRVAKRHFLQKGTLRFFNVEYVDINKLASKLSQKLENADGQILLLANSSTDIDLKKLKEQIKTLSSHETISIVAISDHALLLVDSFTDLLALDWIKKNTKELQGDRVALKEIESRIAEINYQIRFLTDQIFFPTDTGSRAKAEWFFKSNIKENISKRTLSNWLSDICDETFSESPVIKNELINRFRTSSTSTAARTNLLRGILENEGKERLNIEGFPAEYCMFVSLCLETQIYKRDADLNYSFQRDAEKLEKSWQPLWNFLRDYLAKNSYRKVSILELYAELKKPPFGLREAVLPLVLVMFYKAFQEEIAVFSHGTFLAKVKDSDFELMAKAPKYYEIQFCEISGIKSIVFNQIIETFIQEEHRTMMKSKPKLLHIVKMLCGFAADLSSFVKTTAELEPKTKAVRKVLLEAREPASLLYKDLPLACGYLPFLDQASALDDKSALAFVDDLRIAVQQLQRKETELMSRIESNIYNCFGIDHFTREDRTLIMERAENIMNVTLDSMLKGFLVRIADFALDYKAWLESIGTMIIGKPPADWRDEDLLNYEKELAVMQARILKYERIALEIGARKNLNEEVAQVSFISSNDHEVFKIIHLDKKKKEKAKELALRINDFILNGSENTDIDLILASLKECSVKYIKSYNSAKAEANSK